MEKGNHVITYYSSVMADIVKLWRRIRQRLCRTLLTLSADQVQFVVQLLACSFLSWCVKIIIQRSGFPYLVGP